ncbi:MAG: hypothetical protein J7L26_12610 [Candidatus Aminicenantes bacterium]|nr:hypothetical protein [Candidatus Aminicenantes bacterium]
MPYEIRKKKKGKKVKWCVYNKETGKLKGCSDTKAKAVAHMRLLYGVEHGWEPTGKKK